MYDIFTIEAFEDNYMFVIHNYQSHHCIVIDPGDLETLEPFLEFRNFAPDAVLITHHHGDHIGGISELYSEHQCNIYASPQESSLIPDCNYLIKKDEVLRLDGLDIHVIETPGHTKGHISFYVPTLKALFPGDAMFALGAGRLMEGTAAQLWHSLQKIRDLPNDTMVYCPHEYTLDNAEFTKTIDIPHSDLLAKRIEKFQELRDRAEPTVPVRLDEEKQTNLFLRADDPNLISYFNAHGEIDCFAKLRALRNEFKSTAKF